MKEKTKSVFKFSFKSSLQSRKTKITTELDQCQPIGIVKFLNFVRNPINPLTSNQNFHINSSPFLIKIEDKPLRIPYSTTRSSKRLN